LPHSSVVADNGEVLMDDPRHLRAEPFGDFDEMPFHQFLGLTMQETRPDYARTRLVINESTPTGIGGSVHGGVLATMVDMTAVPAVFTNLREGSEPAGTADPQVTYP